MYAKELYEYRGISYTMTELVRMSHLHRETILRRLDMGWSIEEILESSETKSVPLINRSDIGKKIPIVFTTEIPVLPQMQPILGKQYLATICGATNRTNKCRVFYMIELENGKKLITYPGEFQMQIEKQNA